VVNALRPFLFRATLKPRGVSSPRPIWFCANGHMYPHGWRTCYQYASSFFSLSWFYPVGGMDSPLEPHTMTSTGTNLLDEHRSYVRLSSKLVALPIPKRGCRATPPFIPRLKPWAFRRLFCNSLCLQKRRKSATEHRIHVHAEKSSQKHCMMIKKRNQASVPV
jgi:hypothetical protein